ncbi:MAG: DoxX family protein, partial [Bacteroidaceae bacterium]|nr:DoxX family protein [Bacteroidaceae bacterium]
MKILVNICRCILAATFMFSGFVKTNDPLGMQYKLQDYFAVWHINNIPETLFLITAILIAIFEFSLGIYYALGIKRELVTKVSLVFMIAMTILTIYIVIFNPVSDCGCFGDAIILTNGQTLIKNLILLTATIITTLKWKLIQPILSKHIDWIITTTAIVGIIAYTTYAIYALPPIDFRPYKIGTNLVKALNDENHHPQFDVTIVYEKNGEKKELSIDDEDPDSTWTYVETKRTPVESTNNKIIDLYIEADNEDITNDIITPNGDLFLLIAPDLNTADQGSIDKINEIYDFTCQKDDIEFYCITASDSSLQQKWIDYTGAEYIIYNSDERILKTMVRANPGVIYIHNGVITKKWSNWNIPTIQELNK